MSTRAGPWLYREFRYAGWCRLTASHATTRVAKLLAGVLLRVEVIGDPKTPVGHYPAVGDRLP